MDSSQPEDMLMAASKKLKIFVSVLLPFALFFWGWALKNTVQGGNLDLGVVSFMTVTLTSSYLLGITNKLSMPETITARILVTSSHIFVALNYVLGAYFGFKVLDRPGFGIYCIIFTILWILIAFYGSKLMTMRDHQIVGRQEM